jgi:protein-tyrosine phosphatase
MNAVVPLVRVLFVCAGNTCRSPLAQASLARALGGDARRVDIQSAGTYAVPGSPATPMAIEVAHAHGLDLDSHRAQRLTPTLLERADLVLALSPSELAVVRQMSPDGGVRAHLLTDIESDSPTGEGIPDPFGGSREAYEECLRRISGHVDRVAAIVVRELRARGEAGSASRDRG